MKKICVVTSTRAEYGLLLPLIKRINNDKNFQLQLVVTGTHLSIDFGYTVTEIECSGIPICQRINTIENKNSSALSIFAKTVVGFENCFNNIKPDVVILLGDRYEIMAVASVCLLMQIPIVHLCGGDITFGAVDEACRHSITKMSSLHFTGNDEMRRRVIQLGENPSTVFNTGDTGVENILNADFMSKQELSSDLNFDIVNCDYCVVTFHPVTTEKGTELKQIEELMIALNSISNMKYIITKANADDGGYAINDYIKDFVSGKENFLFVSSLGLKRYLSALKYAKMMIGNSSSGIVEAPIFKIPTINVGNRQQGRGQVKSIINCCCETQQIIQAIDKGLSSKFVESIKDVTSIYGDGCASEKMLAILHDFLDNNKLATKKIFYDIKFKE